VSLWLIEFRNRKRLQFLHTTHTSPATQPSTPQPAAESSETEPVKQKGQPESKRLPHVEKIRGQARSYNRRNPAVFYSFLIQYSKFIKLLKLAADSRRLTQTIMPTPPVPSAGATGQACRHNNCHGLQPN